MPQINRIRVNNIKYNFGTQSYDDFVMKPFCKNTLYDLANGGGKSVLMLLLLQNMIPNCTLDEKQPIEKLFRSSEGSKTIHSLIEWKLDEEDIKNGFRYMTTGFCARKAAETEAATTDTAAIEYFNYCIFYRDYNDNDIRNLPLAKEKERITYSGLRRYLKELEKDSTLIVRVFDRKGEYQSFISDYGIYESEWEIIRGINKTEGHVRTYFESNYKTTRKVVEELLIEEILGTSFRKKAGRDENEDVMSKTLLDMKDKLAELAKQKAAIKSYDRQEEVLTEFAERISYLLSVYKEKSELHTIFAKIYKAATYYLSMREESLSELSAEEERRKVEERSLEAELLSAGLSKDREQEKELRATEESLEKESAREKEQRELLQTMLTELESANDYLEYLEEKKKRDETAVTLQAMTGQSGLQEDIAGLVGAFFAMKQEQERSLEDELTKASSAVSGALLRVKTTENARRDIEREQSVTDILLEQNRKECERLYARQNEGKAAAGLLLTEEASDVIYDVTKQRQKAETEKNALAAQYDKLLEEQERLMASICDIQSALVREKSLREQKQVEEDAILLDKERADKLAVAYGEKDYRSLMKKVRERLFQAQTELRAKTEEGRGAKESRRRLEAGELFASSEAAMRVREYIVSRYKKMAMTGAEYLADKTKEEQEALLAQYPGLLSAVVTEGFAEATADSALGECIPEGELVVLLRTETLRGGKEVYLREKMQLLCRDAAGLLEEKKRQREIVRLTRLSIEAEEAIARIQLLTDAYEEDEAFLALFIERYYSSMYGKKTEYTNESSEELSLLEKEKERKAELSEVSNALSTTLSRSLALVETIKKCDDTIQSLRAVVELSKQIAEREKQEKELKQKKERLLEWATQSVQETEKMQAELAAKKAKQSELMAAAEELTHAWERYEVYYQEGTRAVWEGELSELMVQIDGKLQALHGEASSVEDKKRLMDSYVQAMNRLLRAIRTRGISIADITERYEQGALYTTSEEELARKREELSELYTASEACAKQLARVRENRYRLEGKNEQVRAAILEQYGEFKEITFTGEELQTFVAGRQKLLNDVRAQRKELLTRQEKLRNELLEYASIKNELERMFAGEDVLQADCERLQNEVRLTDCYQETRERYAALTKEVMHRQDEFYRNRQTTMETLQVLGAKELADEVSQSIQMPKNEAETDEVIRGLKEVMECLELEKVRIEAGLTNLTAIKENFESQCLQRCLGIKADLERLPKLSRIVLQGEQIPIVSLHIPYVKEEFFAERMSQYIDSVVKAVDEITSAQERMKYIRQALSYKKLFAVIVSDMNAIRLLLYKRERIKEQSRMLPYEEAVGSTGQSQGIYIQFLIAIIHYIASIHSPKGDGTGMSKVIFIDNPFGAAKDVYIWEPIFELLLANHVQLIVPARGVTPALTGRFDVNYVLGQKLIDGRQQTVVVDYSSRALAEALEYIPLQYEQTSLDILEV